MNNLTQKQQDAKKAFLDKQQAEMLARYENANADERKAVIRHIDSFLEVTPDESKNFWLEFREKLRGLNKPKIQKV